LTATSRSQKVASRLPGAGQPASLRSSVWANNTGTPRKLTPGALLE
jgi:hypothetical protein